MSDQTNLREQSDDFVALMTTDKVAWEEAQKAARGLLEAARGASSQERDEVISRVAPLLPTINIGRAALVAITCGALVEFGAGTEPIAQPVLARFSEAVQQAIPFVEACKSAAAAAPADGDGAAGLSGMKAVEQVGEQVSERMPDGAAAFGALDFLTPAALAVLCRSKSLRKQLKADQPLVQAIEGLAALGFELPCFREMLALLDDDQMVVLHPALRSGYEVRIAGIGNNFQLHTLVEDALIGDVEQGWLPGERPSPEVAALARDAPIADSDDLPSAHGIFNLWNWTGLRTDGTLPDESQVAGSEHWIWNEGIPADIMPFDGTRVILIGPAPYPRSWDSGRFFPAMAGEFEVLRQLSPQEAREWLDRIASAPKPTPAGRHITSDDIEDIRF